ncbi:hypothetical protein K4K56_003378 [Colletotrichum sp. SAR 10_98]|nr:hypothetical protein K4K56_003378 [Colletotrichum sp. SAR 10_98]
MRKNEKMPATLNVESDGRTQSLTIFPGYDLVHLTPLATGPDWNTLLRYIPFSSPEFGFGGIRHIAMDFDSSWNLEELERYQLEWERIENLQERTQEEQMDSVRWEMYDSLVQATREAWCGLKTPTVWLVDHRLRRKSTVLDEHMTEMVFGRDFGSWHQEQLVFHAAGCRYYAMPEHYASQFCGYDAEDDPGCDDYVFSFVRELEDVGARQEALENRGDDDWFDDEKKYYATTLRILPWITQMITQQLNLKESEAVHLRAWTRRAQILNLPSYFLGMSLLSNRAPRGLVA